MLKIHNVRLGFATNSSSSRSIVLVAEGEGFSSMYIDAVTRQAGISSYHPGTLRECHPYSLEEVWQTLI